MEVAKVVVAKVAVCLEVEVVEETAAAAAAVEETAAAVVVGVAWAEAATMGSAEVVAHVVVAEAAGRLVGKVASRWRKRRRSGIRIGNGWRRPPLPPQPQHRH